MSEAVQNATDQTAPLRGVVLCCTSILPEQRDVIANAAQTMGAVHQADLTSDVTHLLVGNVDTAKYKYVAKHRPDVKVLDPEFINAVFEGWKQAEDVDVAALEEKHKLPTLYALCICVTGFDDVNQRTQLQQAANDNGATYQGDLTKTVTHLIAVAPQGKKFNYASQWGIKIVAVEWLVDSLERGLVLDESLYHPSIPAEERGKGAILVQRKSPVSPLGKRERSEQSSKVTGEPSRRKLRRTASSKLESQNDDLWSDMTAEKKRTTEQDLNSIPRDASYANTDADPEQVPEPASLQDSKAKPSGSSTSQYQDTNNFIFCDPLEPSRDLSVYVSGFEQRKTDILHKYLESNGAEITADGKAREQSRPPITIVTPHAAGAEEAVRKDMYDLVKRNDEIVSEWWVEKCLHRGHLVPYDEPLCRPLDSALSSLFDGVIICPTAFSGIDLLHFSKATKFFGATYDETLRKETSVLVCNIGAINRDKLKYALEHDIPAVSVQWFWTCLDRGAKVPFEDFAVVSKAEDYFSGRDARSNADRSFDSENRNGIPPGKSSRSASRSSLSDSFSKASEPANTEKSLGKSFLREKIRDKSKGSKQQSQTSQQSQPSEDITALREISPSKLNSSQPKSAPNSKPASQSKAAESFTSNRPSTAKLHNEEYRLPSPPTSDRDQDGPLAAASAPAAPESRSKNAPEPTIEPGLEPASEPVLAPEQDSDPHRPSISDAITELLSHTTKARAAANSSTVPSDTTGLRPRRHRPLGRATSATSASGAGTDGFDPLTTGDGARSVEPAPTEDEEDDIFFSRRRRRALAAEEAIFRPSQALTYEDPEAAAAREKMLKRMASVSGGTEGDESSAVTALGSAMDGERKGTRVESIGVARDTTPVYAQGLDSTATDGLRAEGRDKKKSLRKR